MPDPVKYAEYPQADFSLRIPTHLNGQDVPHPCPNRLRRLYVTLRKLIRKRQETQAMRFERRLCRIDVEQAKAEKTRVIEETKRHIEECRTATAKELAIMAKRIANRDQALTELREKMDLKVEDLQETIRSRERDIKDLVELQLPKIERELEVEREYSKHLVALVKKKLVHEEMQIAVDNQRMIEAEGPANDAETQAMRQMLRGER